MKDFANINHAVGTFPNVTALDCTGPGETDGTAVIADTMTDQFGWIQALLTEVGDTPSGSAEEDTDSQILDAIKLLPTDYVINMIDGYDFDGDWTLYDSFWEGSSDPGDTEYVYFPIFLPDVTLDLSVSVKVDPAAVETGTDRMGVIFQYRAYGDGAYSDIGSWFYDDSDGPSGASLQNIVATLSSYTPTTGRDYRIKVKKGKNTGSDRIYSVSVAKSAA